MPELRPRRQINITFKCNLSCPYCYVKNFKPEKKEISLSSFSKILSWFKKQNIQNGVSILGGEPTQHPKFDKILESMEKNELKSTLYTNGLTKNPLYLLSDSINYIIINYNHPPLISKEKQRKIEDTISFLTGKKNFTLRLNVNKYTDISEIMKICKKYNINSIQLSLVFPSEKRDNLFFKRGVLKSESQKLYEYIRELLDTGIKASVEEPLPFCAFDKKERKFLKKEANLFGECGSGRLYAINPDLSVVPCVIFQESLPKVFLTDFENEKELVEHLEKFTSSLKWEKYLFEECKTCVFNHRKLCQGSCLTYKI
ncbi:MAG: radical SAM protein [Candidatus Aenigmarchaeota archaeon]|nr:radical SAM protein [Candidatus Aenigmarchaeota archaeon]